MCDGVMLMVLGAELGKLIFSGVLNRYFKRRGCCIRLGKRGANSSPLSCEANQGSLGDEEGRKCGPGALWENTQACIKETLEVLSLVYG